MPAADQNVNPARYQLIPRVLVFSFRTEEVCLIRLLPKKGKITNWTGKYNGPGGHVERGEDVASAAARELFEETGLVGQPRLAGMLVVETGQPVGIGLFIFRVDDPSGDLVGSEEGEPAWLLLDHLNEYPLVEDVARILERLRIMQPGDPAFSGRSFYDEDGQLQLVFS